VRAARLAHRDAVETCAEVIADLFRYGGGRVLSLASPLQRYLRDALAASQHIGVSEENYERLGRLRIAHADR
jgi:indole-3-acetate monooxygenase